VELGRTPPIWAFLTGPYALFLLALLLVPFANIAMYSLHTYSPTKVFLPELTIDNYLKIFDLYSSGKVKNIGGPGSWLVSPRA
jgi:ABC-type spermidine/putrescine transport system permease subunit II